jgi:hypothetical protein
MARFNQLVTLAAGAALGAVALGTTLLLTGEPRPAQASAVDRFQDYVMATGAVSLGPRSQADGVWMLDYRSGKLLGTVIDKTQGKIVGWAEVDLVSEFEVQPRQDVHFMMVTGYITNGQSALYVAETVTGKFGVYTMAGGPNGSGVSIRRHDLTTFRNLVPAAVGNPPVAEGVPVPAANPQPAVPATPAAPALGLPTTVPAPGVIAPVK